MPKLLLIENGKAQEIQMGQELTVGRAYSNLLRLEGEEISRVHAIIYRRGDDFIVRDLDSKNGVLLNGQKVMNAILGPGDQVHIGNHLLLFDPPMDYDLNGFLQAQDASMDAEVHTTQPSELDTSYVFQAGASNVVNGRTASKSDVKPEPEVFFSIAELEDELEQLVASPPPTIAQSFLQLQKTLLQESAADGLDGEGKGLAQRLLGALVRATNATRGVVVHKEDPDGALSLAAIVPSDRDVAVNRIVLRSVLREKKAVFCTNAQKDSRFSTTETVKKDRISSILAYPILRREEVIGLLYLDTIEKPGAFSREQLHLLGFVAQLLGLAAPVPQGLGR
jgi:pSer/pThr/pTyr-binding forkhead associated (FHA) protein